MLEEKARQLIEKLASIETELSDPEVIQNQKKYRELSQEHSRLTSVKNCYTDLSANQKDLKEHKSILLIEEDSEMREMLEEEIPQIEKRIELLSQELDQLLVPPDPHDSANTILEIRAGTGGDEAALFVGDLCRMYRLFADRMGWKQELMSATESDVGGYKEFIMVLSGPNVHRLMKNEGGTHRVQRVPETETQGRVHTSAVTVAVLMEPIESEKVEIDEKELRIDTMRSSGAGGQHVNTTDSAVRLTHLPTGIVVGCQEERSQHKNKDKAMRVLKARILEKREEEQNKERSSQRSTQVGTGDRSGRIRTYNFPQNRVTDHRINYTSYSLDNVLQGDLEEFPQRLVKFYHEQKLA